MRHRMPILVCFVLAAFGSSTHANIYTVGSGAGCTHGTIQAAIAAAESHAGADAVHIAAGVAYNNVHITIDTAQDLTLEGGYSTCTQASPDLPGNTVLSASGAAYAILTVKVATGGIVRVRRLELRDAVSNSFGGGGIYFEGNGILEISDSLITNNRANHGGGIYVHGTGSNAELVIGANVIISNNTANGNGGGIYADQVEMSMTEPDSALMLNHADSGYGGGLYIHAGNRSSYAYIGTGGPAGIGAIWGNTARYGGGVALGGENDNHGTIEHAELWLFSTAAQYRGKIAGNSASVAGGAIHMQSSSGFSDGEVSVNARLWNVELDDNGAPQGAGVFLGGDYFGQLLFNVENSANPWPDGALRCPVGDDCGRITRNDAGIGSDGAILESSSATYAGFLMGNASPDDALPRGGIVIEGNRGDRFLDNATGYNWFCTVLIEGNRFGKELVRTGGGLSIRDSTIAGNDIGADTLLSSDGGVAVQRSLLWQPGHTTLQHGGTITVDHVIASEIGSLGGAYGGGGDCGGGACSILLDPMFVDPEHGDYSLRAASPAIDMAPPIVGDDRDVHGRPRDQDLPHTLSDAGPRDLGAIERQVLLPIVLNGNFDFHDLRLWTVLSGTWDGTDNAAGAAGSGSWKMQREVTPPIDPGRPDGVLAGDYVAGEQCIRLPGPWRYLLNGWGKGGGNLFFHDSAVLAWEYRRNGPGDCSGSLAAAGELMLSNSNAWARPLQPTAIDVPEGDFYASTPTLKLRLIGRSGAATGTMTVRFDGITLEVEDPVKLFADGFE